MEMKTDTPRGFDAGSICATLITNVAKSNVMVSKWRGANVTYKKLLELDEFVGFIRNVIDMCTDSNGHDVHVEMLEFAFRLNVILFFTDIQIPDSVTEQFKYLFWTDIYQFVADRINSDQLEALKKAIDLVLR